MLNQYILQTQQLLQNPASPVALYSSSDLTSYINRARGQIAGEHACIRFRGSLSTVAAQQSYNFSSISLSGGTGLGGILAVRMLTLATSTGNALINNVPWEWFNQYAIVQPTTLTGTPHVWAQYAQGANGSLLLNPVPTGVSVISVDCVCYPIPLVDDTTAEAIPYEWTDAVPFFAAYFALLSSQSGQRQADADRMMERYQFFANRARAAATPGTLPFQFDKSSPVFPATPAGIAPKGAA